MSAVRLKYLFRRYVNDTATPEETLEFLSLLRQSSWDNELKLLLEELWNEHASDTSLNKEKAEKIFSQIIDRDSIVKPFQYTLRLWLGAAAAALIIGTLAFFLYTNQFKVQDRYLVKQNVKQDKPLKRLMNLPDGSSVILNANSRIEYKGTFSNSEKREVYLTGEAYFDIKHDPSHPFIVHTGGLQVTVLGTAFNINASPENDVVTVTVTRGKVKVDNNRHAYSVTPNQQIVYNKSQDELILKQVRAQEIVEWKNEDLSLDDVSLKVAADQLQERYHVTINFSNELIKSCRFSATFLKSQTLEQILNVIAEFNNISYKFQNKTTVLLEGDGCNYPAPSDRDNTAGK